jgi:hypothetical protein
MHYMRYFFILALFFSSCILLPEREPKVNVEVAQLKEIKELSDDRFYEEAIKKCFLFKKNFPESPFNDVVILKLGEAFEGLLEKDYRQLVEDGQPEELARKSFLDKYGHYQCWLENPEGIQYNLIHYKEMMEEFPDSPYADEAAYHLIPLASEYKDLPDGPLKEIKNLEGILNEYPTSSLRPQIYYQIAYRLHILHEIYAYSPRRDLRNEVEAEQYREKAFYFYRLVLKQPEQSKFSRFAWEGLKKLEEGKRVYKTK